MIPHEPLNDKSRRRMAWNEGGRTHAQEEEKSLPSTIYNPFFTGRPRTPTDASGKEITDRQDIIRRIKEREGVRHNELSETMQRRADPRYSKTRRSASPSRLLPSPDIGSQNGEHERATRVENDAGLAISRPRSALHRGDFNGSRGSHDRTDALSQTGAGSHYHYPSGVLSTSPIAPWHQTYRPSVSTDQARSNAVQTPSAAAMNSRTRAMSQVSLSGSFTYQPPTSPLVHQANAADISDYDWLGFGNIGTGQGRRHASSPWLLKHASDRGFGLGSEGLPGSQRNSPSTAYQAHQPRRSVTSGSLPHTPLIGQRRPSVSGGSPLQKSLVGSFEESILRGRMSSTPSMPLNFTAQIGVLGKGDCKASLKCPPHITIPFEAHFYSYGVTNNPADSQPSPYVGTIDLDKNVPSHAPRDRRKIFRGHVSCESSTNQSRTTSQERSDIRRYDSDSRKRGRVRQKRRAKSPVNAPKDGYRIPPQGQLQIVIKNPHKTAVKLFLIPYDLSDMQPGQKTFLRQRSYSAGPIIDTPLNARKDLGNDKSEVALCPPDSPQDRPVLRYLTHLHICCPSKGRIYLYKSIRVVFANRVPDGKERLRNELQLPNPKYSAYKPAKDADTVNAQDDAVKDRRRMSVTHMDRFDGGMREDLNAGHDQMAVSLSWSETNHRGTMPSFRFPSLATVESRPASRGVADVDLDMGDEMRSPTSPLSHYERHRPAEEEDAHALSFSRSESQERPSIKAESLLSKRLRDLEMQGRTGGK